ncbi:MAG: TIGR00282 family metallophosphoesterase [Deltaproteobacteria bacterium]|nr:TIGR00282 family metallophosphoesterase [Deltaproteobacteria bacterium]MBW2307120.1 TIGR00282 family metallophosphoesterase [Deltaproteobacteria bacterium]
MHLLFIGDIVGKPGRRAVRDHVDSLVERFHVDLVVANGENVADGVGLTPEICEGLLGFLDVITTGNHVWARKEIIPYIAETSRLIRPMNFPQGVPGKGWVLVETSAGIPVVVANLAGRIFMDSVDCPFRTIERSLEDFTSHTPNILVDFHAEATSEKQAMGWFLDGKVSAVVGTHTHIPTADERLLHNGTAYITDVGMTGPWDSVIGMKKDLALQRFLTQMPTRFEAARKEVRINAVLICINEETGRATDIQRIQLEMG